MLSDYWKNKNLKFLNCNVKQFQTLVNITVDGKYGPITDLVLINYIKIIQEKIKRKKYENYNRRLRKSRANSCGKTQ